MDDCPELVISQRVFGKGPTFRFCENYLDFRGIQWDFRVRYEQLPPVIKHRRTRPRNWLPQIAVFYSLLIALVLLRRDHDPHIGPEGLVWLAKTLGRFLLIVVPLYLLLRWWSQREYTLILAPAGSILVSVDRKHQEILQELERRRLAGLRKLAEPNPVNSPEEEIQKLRWLLAEGAISDGEFEERLNSRNLVN